MENSHSENSWLQRAESVFVGGVNSPVRSFKRVGGKPIIAKRARGAFVYDYQDKEYLDCVMSYGPHLFGHGYAPILESLKAILDEGLCYGMTSEREILWGEKIISLVQPIFKNKKIRVRALSSGTEACMSAIRLARGHTGRELIVKCSGHYHGHVDSLLFDAGSGVATLSEEAAPDSAGLPKALAKNLKVISFNSVADLEKVFSEFGSEIAALILEPVMGNMGVVTPDPNFLKKARELTQNNKALLIFDEVMTGFRVDALSASGRFNIEPDIITFGKIVGGGLPLAAFVAPEHIMKDLAPSGAVYQAGTLSGNPLGVGAGFAMLSQIEKEKPYAALEKLGASLELTLKNTAKEKGLKMCVARCGSMLSVFFREKLPTNALETRDVNYELFSKFFWNAISEGLMLPPSPFEAYFLSVAHIQHQDQLEDKFRKSLLSL